MAITPDHAIGLIARQQHGAFARGQARAAGFSSNAIDLRVRRGEWTRLHRGVLCAATVPMTWECRAWTAILAVGHGAVVSHLSAAHIWALDGFGPPGLIDVTVPKGVRVRPGRGIRVHESTDVGLLDSRRRRGVPVSAPGRTILDVCAALGRDQDRALAALDSGRRQRLVTWAELWETLALHAKRGRTGVVLFRDVLVRRWGVRAPGGHFERTVLSLLEQAGLPRPAPEHIVELDGRCYRIDLAYPELKIAIELDGRATHLVEDAFEADRVRQNRLELAGWLVLRYTWQRFLEDPAAIVDEVRRAIAARSSS
jgi:hypothetical protein